jgi:hypothetical protein
MHGGRSPGAPKGNKNAFKHGRYTVARRLGKRPIRMGLTIPAQTGRRKKQRKIAMTWHAGTATLVSSPDCAARSGSGGVVISDYDYSSGALLVGAGADIGSPETGCFKGTIDGFPSILNRKFLIGGSSINHDNQRRTSIRARNSEGKAVVTLLN